MSKEGCSLCRIVNFMLSLAFLGAGGYMIWYFLGQPSTDEIKGAWENFGGFDDFRDVLGNISDFDFGSFYNNDPYLSDNTTNSWPTSGEGGLSLEVINALDDTWQTEFAAAMDDWENGNPDALTLTITQAEVDYNCQVLEGVQKVCSANFGDTGWLGINILSTLTDSGEILESIAKMNEYYLRNAEQVERQYTMCHELGHGFGLPHTDESFTNPSLGNCMDYTNKPEENLHPDETNYQRLVSLYGTVQRRRLGSLSRFNAKRPRRVLSTELRKEYDEAVAEIEQISFRRSLAENAEGSYWQLVEDNPRGSRYRRELGDDYTIVVHMLHVLDRNS